MIIPSYRSAQSVWAGFLSAGERLKISNFFADVCACSLISPSQNSLFPRSERWPQRPFSAIFNVQLRERKENTKMHIFTTKIIGWKMFLFGLKGRNWVFMKYFQKMKHEEIERVPTNSFPCFSFLSSRRLSWRRMIYRSGCSVPATRIYLHIPSRSSTTRKWPRADCLDRGEPNTRFQHRVFRISKRFCLALRLRVRTAQTMEKGLPSVRTHCVQGLPCVRNVYRVH